MCHSQLLTKSYNFEEKALKIHLGKVFDKIDSKKYWQLHCNEIDVLKKDIKIPYSNPIQLMRNDFKTNNQKLLWHQTF